MKRTSLFVVAALGIAGLGSVYCSGTRTRAPSPAPGGGGPAPRPSEEGSLEGGVEPARATPAAAGPDSPAPPRATPLAQDEMLRLLRAVARAVDEQDAASMQRDLELLLAEPEHALLVAQWLCSPAASGDEQAARGALAAVNATLCLYCDARSRFAAHGEAYTRALIQLLPTAPPAVRTALIDVLREARTSAGPVLDLRFLGLILDVRREHADQAESFNLLLGSLGDGLADPALRTEYRRMFVDDASDPTLVRVALAGLLREEPDAFLPLAEEMFRRGASKPELRAAIAQAIASSAPVEKAAGALGRIASDEQYAQFATFASRSGALEAVTSEYDALLAAEGNAIGRKMLVSAMRAESSAVLLGIARIDPDPRVRLQALLTSTIDRPVDAAFLDELRELRDLPPESGRGISAGGAVLVAENVLRHSTGVARERARDLLIETVRDTRLSDKVRLDAYRRVRPWAPKEMLRGLTVGGQVLE